MKVKKVVKTTTNRMVFNRVYKVYLEDKCRIHCSYCGYHKYENYTGKHYGGYKELGGVKYPNWKLISKNRKQWMKNKIETYTEIYCGREYTNVNF